MRNPVRWSAYALFTFLVIGTIHGCAEEASETTATESGSIDSQVGVDLSGDPFAEGFTETIPDETQQSEVDSESEADTENPDATDSETPSEEEDTSAETTGMDAIGEEEDTQNGPESDAYEACFELGCGEPCEPCPPDAIECEASSEEYACNSTGDCVDDSPAFLGCDEGQQNWCENFIPPCKSDAECPDSMVCSFEGCNPSQANCDPVTGSVEVSEDCGGGVCIENGLTEDLCAGFIPPCTEDSDCPPNLICSFEGCNPSNASCDPATGAIVSTDDCGGGICTKPPVEDLCADFIPPCKEDSECPSGLFCSFEGCNPSIASCDPETGAILATFDCGGGVCTEGCAPGTEIPAGDGCNTCMCPENGNPDDATNCTKKGCGSPCTSKKDCEPGNYCDFSKDTCGADKGPGFCTPTPLSCFNPDGPGVCGCDGSTATNSCMLALQGQDVLGYGGCDLGLGLEEEFECADTTCTALEYCDIKFPLVEGALPPFKGKCLPLPEGAVQGDCTTFPMGLSGVCWDETGYTLVLNF